MSAIRIEIKTRFTGAVLFAHEAEGNTLRLTVEKAVSMRANLGYADLGYANLRSANLRSADLRSADLGYANLGSADLGYANLGYANLRYANLRSADLRSANLRSANLGSANLGSADLGSANLRSANLRSADLGYANLGDFGKLVGERPILQIGPLGSRADYLVAFLTDKGVYIRAGCFFGARAEFEACVTETHGDNAHGREYRAALAMIDTHAELYTPNAAGGE